MRLVVVGSRGYIGAELLTRAGEAYDVVGTTSAGSHGTMSLRLEEAQGFDYKQVRRGDVIVITAAISSPDICRRENAWARRINVEGTALFTKSVIDRGARVIFLSSDTVYGERQKGVSESDECRPCGDYAEMKYEVEQAFAGVPQFKAIRLSYVFSKDDKFTKYLRECETTGETAEIFHPFFRPIVHRTDVVEAIIALAGRWDEIPDSIINCGGPELLARIEFAELLKEHWMNALKLRQIEPDDEFFASRPRVINMQSPLLASILGRPARALRDAIRFEII